MGRDGQLVDSASSLVASHHQVEELASQSFNADFIFPRYAAFLYSTAFSSCFFVSYTYFVSLSVVN